MICTRQQHVDHKCTILVKIDKIWPCEKYQTGQFGYLNTKVSIQNTGWKGIVPAVSGKKRAIVAPNTPPKLIKINGILGSNTLEYTIWGAKKLAIWALALARAFPWPLRWVGTTSKLIWIKVIKTQYYSKRTLKVPVPGIHQGTCLCTKLLRIGWGHDWKTEVWF